MNVRGILFQPPMVRALVDIRKTQTRRAVKNADWVNTALPVAGTSDRFVLDGPGRTEVRACRYGGHDDLLWVRETWMKPYKADEHSNGCVYLADYGFKPGLISEREARASWTWTPSIHMPRWVSRLTLEIMEVRIERLQDITEEDAIQEGLFYDRGLGMWGLPDTPNFWVATPVGAYRVLWERINGPGSWALNPWVWVVSFSPHLVNVDKLIERRAA